MKKLNFLIFLLAWCGVAYGQLTERPKFRTETLIIGDSGTPATNIKFHRGTAGLQLIDGDDTTADGSDVAVADLKPLVLNRLSIGTLNSTHPLEVRKTTQPTIRISRDGSAGQQSSILFEQGHATLGSGATARIAYGSNGWQVSTGGTSGDVSGGTAHFTVGVNGDVFVPVGSLGVGLSTTPEQVLDILESGSYQLKLSQSGAPTAGFKMGVDNGGIFHLARDEGTPVTDAITINAAPPLNVTIPTGNVIFTTAGKGIVFTNGGNDTLDYYDEHSTGNVIADGESAGEDANFHFTRVGNTITMSISGDSTITPKAGAGPAAALTWSSIIPTQFRPTSNSYLALGTIIDGVGKITAGIITPPGHFTIYHNITFGTFDGVANSITFQNGVASASWVKY